MIKIVVLEKVPLYHQTEQTNHSTPDSHNPPYYRKSDSCECHANTLQNGENTARDNQTN